MSYPTGTVPSYVPTGKANALYSLYKWLKARFAEIPSNAYPAGKVPSIVDLAYEQAQTYPIIEISDLGLSQGKEQGLFRTVGAGYQGRVEQTLVEFMIKDMNQDLGDGTTYDKAESVVRLLRDQLKFALQEMAQVDNSGNVLLGSVQLIDANNSDAFTGSYVWHPREEGASAWNETFLRVASDNPNLKQYRITAKIKWVWIEVANNPT